MFLSIITPFYNCFGTIKKCISSLERQSCRDFELILIDDASTDVSTKHLDQLVLSADISIQLLHNDKTMAPVIPVIVVSKSLREITCFF